MTLVHADLRDPDAVLADAALGEVIDLGEPVMALMTFVLHLMPAGQARQAVTGYARRLAPGSIIVISVPRSEDPAAFGRLRGLWPAGEMYNHTREQILSFFAGLDLVAPGVVLARGWRGDMQQASVTSVGQPAYLLGGAARKSS